MTLAIWLLAVGLTLTAVGAWFLFYRDGYTFWVVVMIVGLVTSLAGLGVGASVEEDECRAKGGQEVPSGPPTYVKSGNVLVPIQMYKCEIPNKEK